MKITEKALRQMILQELINTVSGKDQVNRRIMMYRTGPFTNLTRTAFETLDRLEDSIRKSSDLENMDLEGLKNNELQRLIDKIEFIKGACDAKLQGKINGDDGY
tara:strand:- start:128 stop:439 length:312 start_codon:yes stop_codon:yes gene_type:complete